MIDKQQRAAELASENYDTSFYRHNDSTSYIGMVDSWARSFMYYASSCFREYCNRIENDLEIYKEKLTADKVFLTGEIAHCTDGMSRHSKLIKDLKEKSRGAQKKYRQFSIEPSLVLSSHEYKIIENKINTGRQTADDIRRRIELRGDVAKYENMLEHQKLLYRGYKDADVEYRLAVEDFRKSSCHRCDIIKLEKQLANVDNALTYDCGITIIGLSGLCDDFCEKMNDQSAVRQLASYVTATINHATNRRLNTVDYMDSEKEQLILNFSQAMKGYSLSNFCFMKQTMLPINHDGRTSYGRSEFRFDKFMTNFLFNLSLQIRGCVWQSLKSIFSDRLKTQLVPEGKEEFDITPKDICTAGGGYKTANYRLLDDSCFETFIDMRSELLEKKPAIVNSMYDFFIHSDSVKKDSIFLLDESYTKNLLGDAFSNVVNKLSGELRVHSVIGSRLRSMIIDSLGGLPNNASDIRVMINIFRDVMSLYVIDYVWNLNPSKVFYGDIKRGVLSNMKKENKIRWSELEFKKPSELALELLRDHCDELKDDDDKDAGTSAINQRVDFLLNNKTSPDSSSGKYNQNVYTRRTI